MDQRDHACISTTLKIIGAKWTALILRELYDGTRRFGELQKALGGISPRTLSLRLDQLEHDGIITKKIYPLVPLKVEYSITERGKSLREIIGKMRDWGEKSTSTLRSSL